MANRLSRRELFPVLPRILPSKVKCFVTRSLSAAYVALGTAQKPAARSAPAYSRFVNRRVGRALAALCWRLGLSPNAVTGVSAALTATALAVLATAPPTVLVGVLVGGLLLLGYAFDSADGQVARLSGTASPAGEWLDHLVDVIKTAALPLALAIGLFRAQAVPDAWLLVPMLASVVGVALFFAMILTEQLRRQHSTVPVADRGVTRATTGGWVRALLVLPMDYGVLCLSFLLLGALPVFVALYTLITLATSGFLLLAALKWFAELRSIDLSERPEISSQVRGATR